ncbi:hypothetical protein [Nonomuraea sp. NPDC052265]|uniref:hypothetical protein n=1 Tax=Nonomuraea sp. NPDC052265 TaxID=3364374 RepID=UPI0037C896EA
MTHDLTEVRDRLVPPRRLRQVAALLNMPRLDETAATHDDDASQCREQAALYAGIAEWAGLAAQAAEGLARLIAPAATERFAYLVEYTDLHARGWQRAPGEHSEGTVTADTAETVARTALTRYITYLAEHRDDYQLWLVDSLSLRASVWHVDTAAAHPRGRRPSPAPSAFAFDEARIPSHAVEIRTPVQVHRLLNSPSDRAVTVRDPRN